MKFARFTVATLFAIVAVITADLTIVTLEHGPLWAAYMFGFMSVSACVSSWLIPFIIKEAHDA